MSLFSYKNEEEDTTLMIYAAAYNLHESLRCAFIQEYSVI